MHIITEKSPTPKVYAATAFIIPIHKSFPVPAKFYYAYDFRRNYIASSALIPPIIIFNVKRVKRAGAYIRNKTCLIHRDHNPLEKYINIRIYNKKNDVQSKRYYIAQLTINACRSCLKNRLK